MNPHDELDRALDGALTEIRDSRIDQAREARVIERAWLRVAPVLTAAEAESRQQGRIRHCSDFQALLADYREELLPESRRLLLEDHLGECVTCRRALKESRSAARRAARAETGVPGRLSTWAWRAAAVAVVMIAVFGVRVGSFETGGVIHIDALDGQAFRVTTAGAVPVTAGETLTLEPGESLRTAKGSTAMISLNDDSKVEIGERAALAVAERRYLWPGRESDGVIDLDRGNIIIEASEQGSGNLFVETDACDVAVTGTVFAVNHGVKGSRVSVVEGEVRVAHHGEKNSLQPGEQMTTSASLQRIPIEDEIAWSRNAERHLALLREMRAVGRMMDAAVATSRRHDTRLLELAPADTVVYMAIPNLGEGLGQAYDILRQRVDSNAVLAEWWSENFAGDDADDLQSLFDRLRAWGGQFGDEVVLALQLADGEPRLLLATELTRPGEFRHFLDAELAGARETNGGRILVELHDGGTLPAQPAGDRLHLVRRGELLLGSPDPALLRDVLDGTLPSMAGTPFQRRVAAQYQEGVEWLFAFDLQRLVRQGAEDGPAGEVSTLEQMGVLDVQHLIAEHRQLGDRRENRAVLTFDQTRRGVASWLAEPAPMGSLDFVTPDAHLAAAFLMKDPAVLVDELFGLLSGTDDFEASLAEFEREHGIDVRRDFAAPLGGEFALAIDGPLLPVPSWKLVVEVYDPAQLQQTVDWLVMQVNELAAEAGRQGLELRREAAGGREYTHLVSLDTGLGAHYVIEDGYLVAGPSRALLDRAIQARDVGHTLPRSPSFHGMLPRDGRAHFSAVLYQRLHDLMSGPLARMARAFVSEAAAGASPRQQALMQQMSLETPPSVAVLYGEQDRIVFVNTSLGGLFESGLSGIIGYKGLLDVQESLFRAVDDATGPGSTTPADPAGRPIDTRDPDHG